MKELLQYSQTVLDAIKNKQPIVALESTIIAHGMPYPQNAETAKQVEQTVTDTGAVPATIALIDGKICIGLETQQIELIAKAGEKVIKCSRRDLPRVLVNKQLGATTVAATIIACNMAGISIFATGGIGGVHRGAEQSFDISADLQELSKNPVTVVSAGAKSILDLGLTLEYLETHGVPVIGFGTLEFPAFYTRASGFPCDSQCDEPAEVAALINMHKQLNYPGGMLIANPVPMAHQAEFKLIQQATNKALAEADAKGIKGKKITPFLLGRIAELTTGESLRANIALVLNNARLAGEIACKL